MSRRLAWGAVTGQEALSLDGPLVIDGATGYNVKQAKEAAIYRRKRKDAYALSDYTRGFNTQTGGLWIPHSQGENSAAVQVPWNYLLRARFAVYDRALTKATSDPETSERQGRRKAGYASHAAALKVNDKYVSYMHNALNAFAAIHHNLGPDGVIERDRIEENELAYDSLVNYFVFLKSFVGPRQKVAEKVAPDDPNPAEKRKWPQQRYVVQWPQHVAEAHSYLAAMPTVKFDQAVMEAYYSERSRYEYWKTVQHLHHDNLRQEGHVHAFAQAHLLPDMVSLDSDLRANPLNYVDDEYTL